MTIVIAGGGLSGLSLVAHLAAEPRHVEPVVLVDNGRGRLRNSGWGSWTDRRGLLDAAVSRSFDRVLIHSGGRTRVLGLGRYRYQFVRGVDLVSVVDRLLATTSRISCRRGQVEEIGRAHVVVDGEAIATHFVFDSVLGPVQPPKVDATVSFRCWHVHTERPVFDPELPTMFDFRTSQARCAGFVSTVPLGTHRALVEHAAFTAPGRKRSAEVPDQDAALAEYLGVVVGAQPYLVLGETGATVPLTTESVSRRRGDVLAIGGAAGLVKGSTGSGYQRIHRDSAAIVRSLVMRGDPFAIPDSRPRHRAFDGAVLDLITREPSVLERTFDGLFDRSCAERALRFLDEETTVGEETRMFANAPGAAYLGAVARRIGS